MNNPPPLPQKAPSPGVTSSWHHDIQKTFWREMVQKRQKQTSSAVIQWVTDNQPIRREDLMYVLWPDWLRDVSIDCEGRLSIFTV